jgi:glucosamine-6-phosphate isomerase
MKIIISNTYDQLSARAAIDLYACMQTRANPLLCIASGDSPMGMYRNLVASAERKEADFSGWHFVGLDEWVGLNGADEGSCRYHLNRQFFDPLAIAPANIFFFDGRKPDLDRECRDAEKFISERGGIDVAILGLGLNGHIGMNEPGTALSSRSHISTLDAITVQTGQKYFQSEQALRQGITLGIGTLLEAKNIFLLVNGAKKAAIVQRLLDGEISEALPASLLRNHAGARLYLDREAAQMF